MAERLSPGAAHHAKVLAHEPERPAEPWTCPECGTERQAGEFYCDHGALEDVVFSRDMRPRIRSS